MGLIQYRWFSSAALVFLLVGCDPSHSPRSSAGQQPQSTAPALPAAAPQTVEPALPTQQTLHQRRVQQLIDQVERAYAQGDADYRKGRLLEAKLQFDRAVDL